MHVLLVMLATGLSGEIPGKEKTVIRETIIIIRRRSRGSSVSFVPLYRLDDRRSIPSRVKGLFFYPL
jgi:hypothetical protein